MIGSTPTKYFPTPLKVGEQRPGLELKFFNVSSEGWRGKRNGSPGRPRARSSAGAGGLRRPPRESLV